MEVVSQSKLARASIRMGEPVCQISVRTPSHLLERARAKAMETASWSSRRMLMAKTPAASKAFRLYAPRSRLKRTRGGSRETELKELAVKPRYSPSRPTEVTTVIPVAKHPRAWRKLRASKVIRDRLAAHQIPTK